ncbi:hypothetical protein ASG11_08425 [Sphingomonas sp. Leaf357]|uniref:hypothetical protein n=1 Tax=Sphingomonas sp. Leaf357 TaxID=1736350 RepID=UPI0006F903F3|nr:hypothetical protein [Sphingomonas sp. Leaf357]KQS04273.1 hypothetical protein ASG11_08425 [Sphingomonas sp. Leaf357]
MRLPIRSLATLTFIAGLNACVPAPKPTPRPVQRPAPSPVVPLPEPTPLAQDWRDWPYTPGDWVYRQDARGSIALFGVPGAEAQFTIRCDVQANAIYLSRAGSVTAPLAIRTSTLLRTLAVQPTGGTPAYVAAALAPRDGLLEAIGFSRGRFVVQQEGAPTLVIPAWPEIERVTEDCRR